MAGMAERVEVRPVVPSWSVWPEAVKMMRLCRPCPTVAERMGLEEAGAGPFPTLVIAALPRCWALGIRGPALLPCMRRAVGRVAQVRATRLGADLHRSRGGADYGQAEEVRRPVAPGGSAHRRRKAKLPENGSNEARHFTLLAAPGAAAEPERCVARAWRVQPQAVPCPEQRQGLAARPP